MKRVFEPLQSDAVRRTGERKDGDIPSLAPRDYGLTARKQMHLVVCIPDISGSAPAVQMHQGAEICNRMIEPAAQPAENQEIPVAPLQAKINGKNGIRVILLRLKSLYLKFALGRHGA